MAGTRPVDRVELDRECDEQAKEPTQAGSGAALVVVGLATIAFSILAAFTGALQMPRLSAVAFGAVGALLVVVGALRRRRSSVPRAFAKPAPVVEPPATIDLPSLTGQISGVLAQLRRQYGMAYRTRTWIEEMLPAYGADLEDPVLARDLLAAAALDAGGIRADVAGLAESHSREAMVATGWAILLALQNVLAACEVPTDLLPTPYPSDPSSWPASRC